MRVIFYNFRRHELTNFILLLIKQLLLKSSRLFNTNRNIISIYFIQK